MYAGVAACEDDLVVFDGSVPQFHVVGYRVVEGHDVLVDDGERPAEDGARDVADGRVVEFHLAGPGLVEPRHEFGDGGLAATRRPYERDPLARLDVQVEVLDQRRFERRIAERETLEVNLSVQLFAPHSLRGTQRFGSSGTSTG